MARQPDFRETVGSMTVGRWLRMTEDRPICHMSLTSTTARWLQAIGIVKFGSVSSVAGRPTTCAAVRSMEEVISGLWVPQMVSFVAYQFVGRLIGNIDNGDEDQPQHPQRSVRPNAILASWESSSTVPLMFTVTRRSRLR